MPTYQYACTACGHQLEAVQSFRDDALTECPACAGQLRKLFSSVGVVFKGSGFYRTDSRASAKGDGGKGSGGTPDKSDKNAGGSDSGSSTSSGDKSSAPAAATKNASAATSSGGSVKPAA